MYELIRVTPTCGYVESPAKVGVIALPDGGAALIDSGSDKDAAKKLRRHLEANGWPLRMILCTHSHADHIGGNRYLQELTGCRIFAPGIECAFTNHPLLEPAYLYGGNPPAELRGKFLMAKPSCAEPLTDASLPAGVEAIPLPGHSFAMTGFRVDGRVVFLADCLASARTLEKYQVSFLVDVQAYLDTLERVRSMEAECFIPSHAEATGDIAPLAQMNIAKVHEIGDTVVALLSEPCCFEMLLQRLFARFSLTMTFEQYALVGSTLRAYLTWLRENGRIEAFFENGLLCWRAV